jgi:hypothetical protein
MVYVKFWEVNRPTAHVGQPPPCIPTEGHQITVGTYPGGVIRGEHRVPNCQMLQGKGMQAPDGTSQDSDPPAGTVIPQPERPVLHLGGNHRHLSVRIFPLPIPGSSTTHVGTTWATGTAGGTYLQTEPGSTGRYSRTAPCCVLSSHWRVVSNTLQWSRHAGLLREFSWGGGKQPVPTSSRNPPLSWLMYTPWEWYTAEDYLIREFTKRISSLSPEPGPHAKRPTASNASPS